MAFSMLNSIVDTEVKSVLGRADVVIKTKNDIFILELKVDDSVNQALAQIGTKGYAIPYESEGRKVTKCGVSISSEARNIYISFPSNENSCMTVSLLATGILTFASPVFSSTSTMLSTSCRVASSDLSVSAKPVRKETP